MALVLDGTTGIVSANIADGAVVSSKIADGTISASDLASGAITSAALPAGSVIKVSTWSFTTRASLSHTTWYTYFSGTVNKQRANSTLIAFVQCNGRSDANGAAGSRFIAGGVTAYGGAKYTTTVHTDMYLQIFNIEGLTSTGSVGWQYDQTHQTFAVLNPTAATDDARIVASTSRVIIYEVAA